MKVEFRRFEYKTQRQPLVEGLELETLWLTPVDGLTLTANLAFSSAEYDDFISDCFTGQAISQGCNQRPDPVSGSFTGADMSGEALSTCA